MTREDIIKLAHQSGLIDDQHNGPRWTDRVLDFAERVAAIEREACVQLVDDCLYIEELADQMRARGQA